MSDQDDSLEVLQLCCHPALTPRAQVALTLRCVAGLSTAQIARAHLVPVATMGQRISRARAAVRELGPDFPSPVALAERVDQALAVLYLMFTEGHTSSEGDHLVDGDLSREAIRLARQLYAAAPDHREAGGLLALMLLSEARRPARTTPEGAMVPLDEQDRSRWDAALVAEGLALVAELVAGVQPGPYLLQATIAAVHAEAPSAEETDWPQILVLYKLLDAVRPGPVTTLNRAVAEGMAHGPDAGLALLDTLDDDPRLAPHHRLAAVRAHLLERRGDRDAARAAYRRAAEQTLNTTERDYLLGRAQRLGAGRMNP